MTQTQKIIADALNTKSITADTRVYISEESHGISFQDSLCGAYGMLFLKEKIFSVPHGVFIDLAAPLRDDITSGALAEYIVSFLSEKDISGKSIEFGGDSMTYLTMEDRTEIVRSFENCDKKPFCIIFEYDYITAEYTLEHFGKKPVTFFNDGPGSYDEIISLELDKA